MGILELLQTYPMLFIAVCLILGLMVGSFLNVVIHRLPKMLEAEWSMQCAELAQQSNTEHPHDALPAPAYNLIVPRSACPHCNHAITALENIPVISYLVLRGKCSSCGTAISPRYPLVETISGLLCALAAWHFGYGMMATGAIILIWALLALTAIDLDTMLLPDDITFPLLWIGLLFNSFGIFTDLHSAVLGTMAGYLVLWGVNWLFKLTTGKEGMGYGDFKLLAALGAWFGWQMLPLVIVLSSLTGAIVGIALIVLNKQGRDTALPFGPYLAGGGMIALFWGSQLTSEYLQFLAIP